MEVSEQDESQFWLELSPKISNNNQKHHHLVPGIVDLGWGAAHAPCCTNGEAKYVPKKESDTCSQIA